jgi:hypothetical protein
MFAKLVVPALGQHVSALLEKILEEEIYFAG